MKIGNWIIFEKEVTENRDETLVQFDKEAKKRKLMKPFKWIWDQILGAIDWAKQHPGEAITLAMVTASGAYKLIRIIVKDKEIRFEKYKADCRFYDPRVGEYVYSNKKLTNTQKLRFNEMYNGGMSKREALTIMGLIKD